MRPHFLSRGSWSDAAAPPSTQTASWQNVLASGLTQNDSPAMLTFAKLVALMLCLAAPARADEAVVFAAASLKTALDEIAASFADATGHRMLVSYAGSA